MSTVTPDQGQALPVDQAFAQASAPTEQPTPSPDAGFVQAPESAEGGVALQGAPEQPSEPQQPQVSFEEFQRIQQQLQEKQDLLARLEQMAAEQQRREEEQQFVNGLRSRIKDQVAPRVANANSDDEVVEAVYGLVNEVLTNTKSQYQSQVEQYHQQVEQALWSATKPGYADHLMQEYNLPPAIKANLLAFDSEGSMTLAAKQFHEALKTVGTAAQQQAVVNEIQQRQAAGVYATGGANVGPTPQQPLKPGTARQLAPALANIFAGMNRPR